MKTNNKICLTIGQIQLLLSHSLDKNYFQLLLQDNILLGPNSDYFTSKFEVLCEFSSEHTCTCFKGLCHYHLYGANLQAHFVPKILHQNLALILWQLIYGKLSFIVLVPGTCICCSYIVSSVTRWLDLFHIIR